MKHLALWWSTLTALFAHKRPIYRGHFRTCDTAPLTPEAGMLKKIKDSGLTAEDAHALGLAAMPAPPPEILVPGAGFVIPYYTESGAKNGFYRYRYLPPLPMRSDGKPIRYRQPTGISPPPYFSPLFDWVDHFLGEGRSDKQCELLITEGELKAACAGKFKLPCVGLGGVWTFKNAKEALVNGLALLPWERITAYIVYDSDLLSNVDVLRAQNALARALAGRKALVYLCKLPALPGRAKTGLDDYLVARGEKDFRTNVLNTAQLWGGNEELCRLNEEVLYVEDPGMILRRATGQTMKCTDFWQHQYADRTYFEKVKFKNKKGEWEEKTVVKSTAREWIKWTYHARVNKLTYQPGQPELIPSTKPEVAAELNLWPGWGVTPARGDIKPWKELLDFLFRAAPTADRRWFEQWLAYPIQHPGTKLYTAVLLWGRKQGTGKSLMGYTMGDLYGKYTNFAELNHQDLFGAFNGWAARKQFAMGEEIATGDTRNVEHLLKSLITRESIRINAKWQPHYDLPDCINYYFTSNASDALLLQNTDRRFFVLEVVGNETLPAEFYRRYNEEWREKDGVAHLMYHLQHLDLTGFQPGAPAPMTAAKADMIVVGRTDLQDWVQRLSADAEAVLPHSQYSLYTAEELVMLFDPYNRRHTTTRSMGKALAEYFPKANRRGRNKKAKVRGLLLDGEEAAKRALYMVRDKETLSGMTETELAARYNEERKPKPPKHVGTTDGVK